MTEQLTRPPSRRILELAKLPMAEQLEILKDLKLCSSTSRVDWLRLNGFPVEWAKMPQLKMVEKIATSL